MRNKVELGELEVMVIEKLKRAGLTIDLMSDIVSDGDNRRAINMVSVVEQKGFKKMFEFNIKPLSEGIDFHKTMKVNKKNLELNWESLKEMLEFFHEPRRAVVYSIPESMSVGKLKDFVADKGGKFGNLLGLMLLFQQFGKKLPKNLWLLSLCDGEAKHIYKGVPTCFYLVKGNNNQVKYYPIDEAALIGNRFSVLFFF